LNPITGRFASLDPFSGVNSDPHSLHKYLYCFNNPSKLIDPSGKGIIDFLVAFAIRAFLLLMPVANFLYLTGSAGLITMIIYINWFKNDLKALRTGIDPATGEHLSSVEWHLLFVLTVADAADPFMPEGKVIKTGVRKGKSIFLRYGDDVFGWVHIRKRHISGELPGKFTSYFPVGSGQFKTSEIKTLIIEAAQKGKEIERSGDNVLVHYDLKRKRHGVEWVEVYLNKNTGNIITAYPGGKRVRNK